MERGFLKKGLVFVYLCFGTQKLLILLMIVQYERNIFFESILSVT